MEPKITKNCDGSKTIQLDKNPTLQIEIAIGAYLSHFFQLKETDTYEALNRIAQYDSSYFESRESEEFRDFPDDYVELDYGQCIRIDNFIAKKIGK